MKFGHVSLVVLATAILTIPGRAAEPLLTPQALLDHEAFWDNRDWDWYRENIPFFECPDADLQTTYYYRWELLTKHLTYGSPNSGYSFTEFIDRPFWSGAYGAISCPAGHQLYEARWLREKDPATLHELAAEFGVSAERIRQIEAKALGKMRGMIGADLQ